MRGTWSTGWTATHSARERRGMAAKDVNNRLPLIMNSCYTRNTHTHLILPTWRPGRWQAQRRSERGCSSQRNGKLRQGQGGCLWRNSLAPSNQEHQVVDYLVAGRWKWLVKKIISFPECCLWLCASSILILHGDPWVYLFLELDLALHLDLVLSRGVFLWGTFTWELIVLISCLCAWTYSLNCLGGEFVTWGILL